MGVIPSAEPPDAVDLADAVRAVRDGLLVAEEDGRDSPLKFELGEIQVEFTVEVRRETKASGGVKAWVVNGSAEAGGGGTRTQRIAFTLKPVRADAPVGAGWRIADEEAGNSWAR